MENVLTKVTQLLQSGEPEDALLLLNQLSESTTECEQLKAACKQALSEQYLWLLNDAVKGNRADEIKAYVSKYLYLIGKDERIARYEDMINKSSVSNANQRQASNDSSLKYGELALIPVIFLILSLLINAFWGKITEWELLKELSCKLDLRGPWIIPLYISEIFHVLYVASATFVFWRIKDKCNSIRNFDPQTIWLFVWSGLLLISSIFAMICGFKYKSIVSLQGIRVCIAIGSISLIVFMLKQIIKSVKFRIPLIIAIVATVLEIVWLGILFGVYIQNKDPYGIDSLVKFRLINNICYYGRGSLMLISFIMLFIMSQRTKSKQYGTN